MLRFAILQRIVELTRPFAPPSPWEFLPRSAKVRSLGPVRCKNEGKPFQHRGLRDFSLCPV